MRLTSPVPTDPYTDDASSPDQPARTAPPRPADRQRARPTRSGSTTPATSPARHTDRTRRRSALRTRLVLLAELVVLLLLLSGSAAYADTAVLALAGSIDEVLNNIRAWLMGILAGLATVFFSIGGVRYVWGGGDPGEIEKAKTAFKAAGIGYGLAALAPLVVTVLKGIVGA